MSERVLIIDDVHESLILGLESAHYHVMYMPEIKAADVLRFSQENNISGLVVRSKMSFSGEFLHALSTLKWIARAGVGTDNIDVHVAQQLGIKIVVADGANAVSVAEHVLGMLLSFLHKLYVSNDHVKNGGWDRESHRGIELSEKVVGIIGMGNTGTALARLLVGFNVRVFAYDKYKHGFGNHYIKECDTLEEVYRNSDVLSYHVPLTEETKGMIGEVLISALTMEKRPIVINASRGGVFDAEVMKRALDNRQISGLLLDVWPTEPPTKGSEALRSVFDYFVQKNNVMFSPHVGGWSVESYERISRKLLTLILNNES